MDARGVLVYADERFCELVGATASELLGHPLGRRLTAGVEAVTDPVAALLRADDSLTWATTLRGDVPATVLAIPVARARGEPLGALLVVTERARRAPRLPLPAPSTMATLFDAAFGSGDRARALIGGREQTVLGVNARCADLLGLAARDIVGSALADIPRWHEPREVTELCERAMAARDPVRGWVGLHANGREVTGPAPLQLIVSPLPPADAAVVTFLGSAEPGREPEAWGHAHRLEELGRLAGGIAHDFNNLLAVVQAYAQIIMAGVTDGSEVTRSDVEEITHAVNRGRQLTRHLLALTRNVPIERRLVDVNATLRAVSGMLRPLLGTEIALGFYLSPELPPILTDPVQLDQVILNLAINACDAMPGAGHLSIATRHVHVDADDELLADNDVPGPGEYVVIEVADTGHGMDRETKARIFEPFFTTRSEVGGTGLGLSVVAGIVSQAGGRVVVHSVVGRGTTFRLFWPTASPIDDQITPVSRGPAATECVMVIQHDASVRQLVRRLLAEAGFDSAQARDAPEALQMLTSRWPAGSGPSVVLADVGAPEVEGRELARLLADRRPDLPLVLLSACAEQTAPIPLPRNVPVPVLPVPFDNTMLIDRIRTALARWRS